ALRRSDNENMLSLVILILRSILTDLQGTLKGKWRYLIPAITPIHNHVLIPNYQDFKIQDFRFSDGFECFQAINIGRQMSHIVWRYTDRVGQRLDLIAELEKLQGSILAFETIKLLRDVNDSDLSKVRAFMTTISQILIKVLVCKRKGVVVDKLEFSEDFPNLSSQFCDEINKEFLELFDSPSISSGTCYLDLDIDEDADEFRMNLEEEEMLLFKEEQILEEESRPRLEEEAKMMREDENILEEEKFLKKDYKKRELVLMNSDHMKHYMVRVVPKKRSHCTGVTSSSWLKVSSKFKEKSLGRCVINQDMAEFLKNVKPWSEDLSHCNTSIDNVWLTEDLDLYLGKPGMLRCRFLWCNDQMVNRKFWESLVCLDPTRTGWLLVDVYILILFH
nr:phospholipase-like protein [Tanacetum cinerariifolium]